MELKRFKHFNENKSDSKILDEHGLKEFPKQGLNIGKEKIIWSEDFEANDGMWTVIKFKNKEDRNEYCEKHGGLFHPSDNTKLIPGKEMPQRNLGK